MSDRTNSKIYIALCVMIVIFFVVKRREIQETFQEIVLSKKVCNDVDGRCYTVSTKFDQTEEASRLLAATNKKIIKFLRYLREKYIWSCPDGTSPVRRHMVERLLTLYDPDSMIENAPIDTINTSYVEDKGKVFALCLREKASGRDEFERADILFFVTLHELSHISNATYGHEPEFWQDFKILLQEAEQAGLYKPVDFRREPASYCGLDLNYNPYFDDVVQPRY